MYSLRLFIVVLQELHCLPNYLHVCMIRVRGCYHIIKFRYSKPSGCGVFIEKYVCTKFHHNCVVVVSVSYMAIYVSIVIYGPRVVLQELHCLLTCLYDQS